MKKALRKELTVKLARVSSEQLERQSDSCAAALRRLPGYQKSRSIAFYMHMQQGSELQTDRMISNAFEDGKRIFLPHIVPYAPDDAHPWFPAQTRHLRMLEVPSLAAVRALEPVGKYRLREPTEGLDCFADRAGLDMIVVPGVGFSATRQRIGHGAGFYDSFVSEHEHITQRTPLLVGVGLEEQLVAAIPTAEHDRALDAVIIGGTVYE